MLNLFKKRVLAYLIDFFIVSALMWIFAQIAAFIIIPYSMFLIYNYFIFLIPFVILLYFVISEKKKRTTVGKNLMFLEIVSMDGGEISYKQAIIRNLSKLYWLPIIGDVLIGKLVKGSNDRILGELSKTNVIIESNSD
jgi:uncharacterized RDD family membrane protein YckC